MNFIGLLAPHSFSVPCIFLFVALYVFSFGALMKKETWDWGAFILSVLSGAMICLFLLP